MYYLLFPQLVEAGTEQVSSPMAIYMLFSASHISCSLGSDFGLFETCLLIIFRIFLLNI